MSTLNKNLELYSKNSNIICHDDSSDWGTETMVWISKIRQTTMAEQHYNLVVAGDASVGIDLRSLAFT